MTDESNGVSWAHGVVDQGWPGQGLSLAAKRKAYEDLEAAYYILAEDAAEYGHMDRHKEYNDLADQAYQFAIASLGHEERRR